MLICNNEYVQAYIDYRPYGSPNTKKVWQGVALTAIAVMPSALLGKHADITAMTLLPLFVALLIFAIYVSYNLNNHAQFVLFYGCNASLLSLGLLVASYKLISIAMLLQTYMIVVILLVYIMTIILVNLHTCHRINNGYFFNSPPNRPAHSSSIGLAAWIFIVLFAHFFQKWVANNQDIVVIILASLMLLLSFIFTLGTPLLLKFYFMRTIKNRTFAS